MLSIHDRKPRMVLWDGGTREYSSGVRSSAGCVDCATCRPGPTCQTHRCFALFTRRASLSHQGSETAYKTAPGVPRIKRPPKKPTEKEKKKKQRKKLSRHGFARRQVLRFGGLDLPRQRHPPLVRPRHHRCKLPHPILLPLLLMNPWLRPPGWSVFGSSMAISFPRFVSGCFVVAANFLWNVRALANWRF